MVIKRPEELSERIVLGILGEFKRRSGISSALNLISPGVKIELVKKLKHVVCGIIKDYNDE